MDRGGPSSHGPPACSLTASARLSLANQGDRPCPELFQPSLPWWIRAPGLALCVCVCPRARWSGGRLRPTEDPTK